MKIKYPPPETKLWGLLEWTDIPSKNNPELVYLRRLRVIQTPWTSLYLHWINEPDTDRHPHDHPWIFLSFILRGGYRECVYADPVTDSASVSERTWYRTHSRWSLHKMHTSHAHSITSVHGNLVTLVLTGPRVRNWYFWTEDGLVPWREYLGSREPNDQRVGYDE